MDPRHPDPTGRLRLLELLREDWSIHWRELSRPGFLALAAYRVAHRADAPDPLPLRSILAWSSRLMQRLVRRRYGIYVDPRAEVGRRLMIGHQGGIRIGPDVVLGNDCVVHQGTRIGSAYDATPDRVTRGPRLGDRVRVGARAVVSGAIDLADDVRVGPNAVVSQDVAEGALALAPPSPVLREPAPTPPLAATAATVAAGMPSG